MTRDALDTFRDCLGEPGWDDLVAGYDFGFLDAARIQAWCASRTGGPALASLQGAGLQEFESRLWAACEEATGRTPRPGSLRWAHAQDRWRLAMLRSALATETTLPALARRVEQLYEQMGCPEDMLPLLRPSPPWNRRPATVDAAALVRFLDRCELRPEPA